MDVYMFLLPIGDQCPVQTLTLVGTSTTWGPKVHLGEVYDVPGILDGILRGLEGIPGVLKDVPEVLDGVPGVIGDVKIFQEHLRGFNDPSW